MITPVSPAEQDAKGRKFPALCILLFFLFHSFKDHLITVVPIV